MNKKGALMEIAIILLILIILSIYLIGVALRDCNNNNECSSDSYCGSDYKCHSFPEEIIVKKNNFFWPALIIAVAIVIATYINKTGKVPLFNKNKNKKD